MSIRKAIDRAFRVAKERNEPIIYWAVDLHGVVLKSNYEQGGYQFTNDLAPKVLKRIADHQNYRVILWSSCDIDEQMIVSNVVLIVF